MQKPNETFQCHRKFIVCATVHWLIGFVLEMDKGKGEKKVTGAAYLAGDGEMVHGRINMRYFCSFDS